MGLIVAGLVAPISRGPWVGAGALVTEGKQFPDNSLIVGSPARAIRILTEDEIAKMQRGAPGYVANWRRHAAQISEL